MSLVYLPSGDPEQWRTVLAEPDRHWRKGYSARTLAYCWHDAAIWPPEIARLLGTSAHVALHTAEPLLKLVEHQTELPGRGYSSQSDLFVLARAGDSNLMTITVEGKVNEPFGETLDHWKARGDGFTINKRERLEGLCQVLGLSDVPDSTHYQLLHRTASAVLEARRFNARYALMIVHSFSQQHMQWDAFAHFTRLYRIASQPDTLYEVARIDGLCLCTGWATGDPRYLEA
jgi:hypothetical protein